MASKVAAKLGTQDLLTHWHWPPWERSAVVGYVLHPPRKEAQLSSKRSKKAWKRPLVCKVTVKLQC
jgi:hypothetical protein